MPRYYTFFKFNSLLHSIDKDFIVLIKSNVTSDNLSGLDEGRPRGGLDVFFRISSNIICGLVYSTDSFVITRVACTNRSFILCNIYLPCDDKSSETLIEYRRVLGELQSSLDVLDDTSIILMGDYNADPNKGRFWPEIREFVHTNQFKIDDLQLPYDSFTYLSAAHNSTSWLDHIVSSGGVKVNDVRILYDLALFDHFPIGMSLYVDENPSVGQSIRSFDLINELVD